MVGKEQTQGWLEKGERRDPAREGLEGPGLGMRELQARAVREGAWHSQVPSCSGPGALLLGQQRLGHAVRNRAPLDLRGLTLGSPFLLMLSIPGAGRRVPPRICTQERCCQGASNT